MHRKQLFALFVTNLVVFTVARALLMLLPIYFVQLGTGEMLIGLFLSLVFASLAIATLGSGWLSNRFQNRKWFIVLGGAVSIPATFLMGQVSSVILLTVFVMILFAAQGMILTMGNILTGMYADPEQRGRTFGIIGTTVMLGAILSGFTMGAIVDRWGYITLFTMCAFGGLVQMISGTLLEDGAAQDTPTTDSPQSTSSSRLPKSILLVIVACAFTAMALASAGMTRPLLMDALGFSASAITTTVAIGGIVALPLPLIIGWLSDKLGRNRLLVISSLAVHIGMLMLVPATHLWQFWLSTILLRAITASQSVGMAWINDLATPETLATATARFSAGSWIANVISFSLTGIIIQTLGLRMTFLYAALLPVISIILVLIVSYQRHPLAILRAGLTSLNNLLIK